MLLRKLKNGPQPGRGPSGPTFGKRPLGGERVRESDSEREVLRESDGERERDSGRKSESEWERERER